MLRVVAVAIPVGAAVLASVLFSHIVHYPDGFGAIVLWWLAALIISSVVVAVVEKQSRRLLPLATLLKLSMIFPDKAPSRYGVALRAGTVRNLEERVIEMRARGVDDEPSRAAEQILELVGAMGVHDRGTRGHAERVRAYADLLAIQMGLSEDERDRLRWAALLHDVGKVAVPSELLNKAGKPDEDEWAVIHRHPEEGGRLVAPLRHWLGDWVKTVEQHHERWDGMGYPHQLKGIEISRGARMVAVADAFEVMTAARSYKKPMDVKAARAELTAGAGTQFDPAAVRAFLNISLGRTRWMVGPLAWLAQLPFMQGVPGGMGGQVAGVVTRVVAAATIFAGAAAPVAASGAPSTQAAPPLVRQSTPDTTVALPPASEPGAPPPPTPDSTTTTTAVPIGTTTTVVVPPAAPAAAAPPPTAAPKQSVGSPPTTAKPTPTTKPPVTGPPPTTQPDKGTTHKQNPVDIDVTHNDTANVPGGFVYPITILDTPGSANVSVQPDGHTVHYVPNNQAKGQYDFHYQVCNTTGACATGTVTVKVE